MATQRPYDNLPARPLGKAAATARDTVFLDAALASGIPAGYQVPPVDEVAVIRRVGAKSGDIAWLADGRTFCFGVAREGYSSYRCGRIPEKGPAPGLLVTVPYTHDRVTSEDDLDEARVVSFVIAEGGPQRFDHVKRGEGTSPVYQAVARFPSGRMVTFLTFDHRESGAPLDPDAEICRSDRAVCFPSEPVPY
ncbi:hypothetical protein [Streptomyces sp. NPDC059491]|uniref:hypothetical protein n=1 Tax=Streptomyces sp. NPDC059491 TaxID=3346850 RepID=UPI0036C870EA